MKEQFERELSPQVREKMRKNLVYAALVSITMMFAGLVSAYIVSMGGAFWLKIPLPIPFFVSTTLIVLSSFTFVLSVRYAKKNDKKKSLIFVITTFLLGIAFAIYQFKGYTQLVDKGIYFAGSKILVSDGRYGDYFTLKYKGKHLIVEGNDYLIEGKIISQETKQEIQSIGTQFIEADQPMGLNNISGYGQNFTLFYERQPLSYINGKLMLPEGQILEANDLYRLRMWATHIRDGRGDFFAKGEFGKDFHVFYKGKELSYKDRTLHVGDQKLSPYLLNKAMDSADNASSFLYIITFLHLLHVIGTLIFMIRTISYSLKGKYTQDDTIGLRATGIFWHYLTALWLFLLLFLLFIH